MGNEEKNVILDFLALSCYRQNNKTILYDGKKNGETNGSGYKLKVKTCRRSKGKPKVTMKYQLPIELKIVRML